MKCRICEMEIPDGTNFCQVCGSRQSLSHCINCGTTVAPDACYCPNCGILLYKPKQEDLVNRKKKRKRQSVVAWLLLIPIILILVYLTQQF